MGGILKGGEKLRVNPLVAKKPERTLLGMPPLTNPVTAWLSARWPEAPAMEFYRDVFPQGELERKGEYVSGKYCGIAIQVVGDTKAKRFSVTDDLEIIEQLTATDDFCVMSPISYAGKRQKQDMARFLYALAIDVDGIRLDEHGQADGLEQLWYQMTAIRDTAASMYAVPVPTYIVSSGRGIHLYYLLERPLPLFQNVLKQLVQLRYALINRIWNEYVTTLCTTRQRQYESVTQGFRMVGTITKDGGRTRAFRVGEKVSLEYLNSHVGEDYQVKTFAYKRKLSLEEAKEKYPAWYQKRVVEQQPKGAWKNHRALYDWWKRKILEPNKGAVEGHRYFCIMALAIYAAKCGIKREELERDAFALIPQLNRRGNQEKNPFTTSDVLKALEAYNGSYLTFPRRDIEKLTGIVIAPNKRNFRSQKVHLRRLRAVLDIDYPDGSWRNTAGAPSKRDLVVGYLRDNPSVSVTQAARDLGVSRPTIYKYRDQAQKARTVEEARAIRDIRGREPDPNRGGASTKGRLVRDYASAHPDATQREIAEALGISKTTVNKWLKGWSRDTSKLQRP